MMLWKPCVSGFNSWHHFWGYMNLCEKFRRVYRGWGSSPSTWQQPVFGFAFATLPMYAPMEAEDPAVLKEMTSWNDEDRIWLLKVEGYAAPKNKTFWSPKNINLMVGSDVFPSEIVPFLGTCWFSGVLFLFSFLAPPCNFFPGKKNGHLQDAWASHARQNFSCWSPFHSTQSM